MNAKMYLLLWILSIVAMFVVDVRTGTLQQKDLSPRRCHQCGLNSTACELPGSAAICPAGRPYCATVASAPNFTSTLTCAVASELACSLRFNSKLALEMTCICDTHFCNAPYSAQLRNELLNFSTKIPANNTELTTVFLKTSVFTNVTKLELYNMITKVNVTTEKPVSQLMSRNSEIAVPRAEALKHEATVPPDDDEDESEGSGTFEEPKSQAAPAAPSSFLPAEENNVAPLIINLYLLLVSTSFNSLEIL